MEDVSGAALWQYGSVQAGGGYAAHGESSSWKFLPRPGVPPGVVNLVHGRGEEAGAALVRHTDVQLVSFTGSAAVGREIASVCGQNLKRVSLELGGKNAQIVMEDADFDLALEGALWGAFGTTGQRCTATSRLIVHRDVAKKAH